MTQGFLCHWPLLIDGGAFNQEDLGRARALNHALTELGQQQILGYKASVGKQQQIQVGSKFFASCAQRSRLAGSLSSALLSMLPGQVYLEEA